MLPAVGSISRSMVRPTVDLPQPDSPTSAERLAVRDREAHAVDREHGAAGALQQARADREMLLEIA